MIRTTENFCAANTSATSSITAFAPALAVLTSKRTLIDQLDQIAIGTTKGVTTDTNLIRKTMTDIAVRCAAATYAYASSVKNNTLKAQVNFTEAKLNAIKKEEVDDVCQTIHDVTDANIANASNYGISAGDVSSLQIAINLYRTSVQNPRQAKITKDDAIRQIKQLIRDIIDNSLKGQMDKMMLTLKMSNPNFVNKYFGAREIIDLGKTTGKLRGTTTDPSANKLKDVTIILRETGQTPIAYQTLSAPDAKFKIVNVKPGNYDIEVSHTNFQTITETNIRFGPGKELQRKYVLTPAP